MVHLIQMASNSAYFFKAMLDQGIHLAPSKYEAWFLTTAHTQKDIEETIAAAENAFSIVANHFYQ